jgi:hypothetical protein
MSLRPKTVFTLLAVLVAATVLRAGNITDNLAEEMMQLEPGETISTLVMMTQQYPAWEQDQAMHNARVPLNERHALVLNDLHTMADDTQQEVISHLTQRSLDGAVADWHSFYIANMIAVDALPEVIRELAERNDVGDIYFDYPVENCAPIITPQKEINDSRPSGNGLTVVNADRVWFELGIIGTGALVCNIDTGVDGGHSALTDRWRGNSEPAAECFYDPVNGTDYPYDSGSHGTHTMGTITGMSPVTGDTVGIAFGAEWICAATIDHPGGGGIEGTIVLALQSFEWAVDPDGDPGSMDDVPDVISNSWGIPHAYRPECDETYWVAIDNCEAAGSLVVFAAGNESTQGLRSPSSRATTEYSTYSVAALDISDPDNPYVASFSSRGPSHCTTDPILMIKPEVSAPGVDIYSSVPGGGYAGGWSGTSMACPHVAGLVGLMRSANPGLDVTTMKQIIMDTAIDLDAEGNDNNTGWGMIDCYEAVLQSMTGYGRVDGYVDAGTGEALPALVSVVDGAQQTNANVDGNYMMSLPGDESYTLAYSYFGYITDQQTVYVAVDDTTTADMTLYAADSGTLEGYVYDPNGQPVDGAVINVLGTPLPEVYTNGVGFYTMDIPGDASYDFEAFGAGWGTQVVNDFAVPANMTTQLDFNLPLDPMFLPSGPDDYGYMIYDSNDEMGPIYNWTSISDVGTVVVLSDDDYETVTTGFDYDFYGTNYTQLCIGSNGYVTPGASGYTTYSNQTVPNSSTPNGSLYGYWDDLNPSSGGTVYYYNNAATHQFIVEYNDVSFYGGGGNVTFQIVIQDPLYHPSITGDAQWLVFYNSIDDRASATVGIENSAGTDGIQYVYDGNYDENASPIEAGLALLITTGQVSDGPHIAFDPALIDLGEIYIDLPLVVTYTIINFGLDPLEVTDIIGVTTDGDLLPDQTLFTIDPVGSVTNTFTVIPNQVGDFSGLLVHFNNSDDNPEADLQIIATVSLAPDIAVSPPALAASLPPGGTEEQTLTISNLGAGELVFDIDIDVIEELGAAVNKPELSQPNPGEHFFMTHETSGPTASYGDWIPSEPVRENDREEDILVVSTTTVDGSVLQVLNDLALLYDYQNTPDWTEALFEGYPTIIVAMDGGLVEEASVLALANAANAGAQVISIGGTNWTSYYTGMQNYIIGHTGEQGWTTSSTPHLQVTDPGHPLAQGLPDEYTFTNTSASYYMLRANDPEMTTAAHNGDGWPDLFAKPMESGSYAGFLNSAMDGYWSDPSDYNILLTAMTNMLGYAAVNWLSVAPLDGTVPAWDDIDLTVTFDATDLEEGVYYAEINIASNDPDQPLIIVPATLTVGYGCETHDIEIVETNWNGGMIYLSITGGEVGNQYDIYRSEDPYSFSPEPYATVMVSATPQVWTDSTTGANYFYRVVETCDLVVVGSATTSPEIEDENTPD